MSAGADREVTKALTSSSDRQERGANGESAMSAGADREATKALTSPSDIQERGAAADGAAASATSGSERSRQARVTGEAQGVVEAGTAGSASASVSAGEAADRAAVALGPLPPRGRRTKAVKAHEKSGMIGDQSYDTSSRRQHSGRKDGSGKTRRDRTSQSRPMYRTRIGAWTVIAIGWGVSLTAVVMRGGAVETFVFALLTAIMAASVVVPLAAIAGLEAVRKTENNGAAGRDVPVRLILKRKMIVPFAWFAIRDEAINVTDGELSRAEYRFVGASLLRKELQIDYRLRGLHRGEHRFAPVTVTVGDLFGLTAVTRHVMCEGSLLALPALPKQPAGGDITSDGTVCRDAADQSSLELMGTGLPSEAVDRTLYSGIGPDSRPYREGDSPRHIDWRSAARGRGLHTKRHAESERAELVLVVDSAVSAYGGDARLFDACVAWAAQQSEAFSLSGVPARIVAADQKGEAEKASVQKQLERLAKLRMSEEGLHPDSGKLALGGMRKGSAVQLYTGNWHDGKSWRELALHIAREGGEVFLHIVTKQTILTYAMREQQRYWESCGYRVNWLPFPEQMNETPFAAEGGVGGYAS
ncbi:DUF58 domain-containing protein [Paenibacillus sp. NPDC058071]|uniref:DUF58 domain-containing protein n=1 Tax=Paenibacillus sp. NPDC058071 TaxID=3346326 RepID=UPI0036DBF773